MIRSVGPGLDDFLFFGMLGLLALIALVLVGFTIATLISNRGR